MPAMAWAFTTGYAGSVAVSEGQKTVTPSRAMLVRHSVAVRHSGASPSVENIDLSPPTVESLHTIPSASCQKTLTSLTASEAGWVVAPGSSTGWHVPPEVKHAGPCAAE